MKTLWRDFSTTLRKLIQRLAQQLFGAIAFYTTIPIPTRWPLDFSRIARWSPWIGGLIAMILLGLSMLGQLCFPSSLLSVMLLGAWIVLTGALHLDGAMDTADGLGVFDPQKRLTVMMDSRSGAFGVITAIVITLLKTTALRELLDQSGPSFLLLVPVVWGRWAHVLAVGQYPYLKSEGKGAMHHADFNYPWDYVPGFLCSIMVMIGVGLLTPWNTANLVLAFSLAHATALGVGYGFFRQFCGMTGDIHGAIVEWTETIVLLEVIALNAAF